MNEQTPQTVETRIIARALQDESFKQCLLSGPDAAKAAIEEELDAKFPDGFDVQVLEETTNVSYIVLPAIISTEEMSEEELETVAGGKGGKWRRRGKRAGKGAGYAAMLTPVRLPCTLGSITIQ